MAAKKTSKKAPAKREQNLPAMPFDFAADAGAGMEGADKDSFAIPFLRVIQKTSPQVDEADAEYMEEAKVGMFINTVTNKLYDGKEVGLHFLPCAFQRRFLLWAPRDSDGGFKGEFLPEQVAALRDEGKAVELDGSLFLADDDGKVSEKKSDKFSDTRSHFGIAVDAEGNSMMVLLALTSTQIKKSKQLMSIMQEAKLATENGMVTPPTWMNKIKMTTVLESNDQGSWYGVRFEADGFIDSADLYNAGKAFHEQIAAGEAGANYAEADGVKTESDKF